MKCKKVLITKEEYNKVQPKMSIKKLHIVNNNRK